MKSHHPRSALGPGSEGKEPMSLAEQRSLGPWILWVLAKCCILSYNPGCFQSTWESGSGIPIFILFCVSIIFMRWDLKSESCSSCGWGYLELAVVEELGSDSAILHWLLLIMFLGLPFTIWCSLVLAGLGVLDCHRKPLEDMSHVTVGLLGGRFEQASEEIRGRWGRGTAQLSKVSPGRSIDWQEDGALTGQDRVCVCWAVWVPSWCEG